MPRRRRVGALILGVAILGGGVLYVHHIHWRTTLAVMAGAAPAGLALAYLLHLVSLLAKSGVWWVCLRAVGRPGYGLVVRLTFFGSALNSLLVANSGEVGRVVLIARLARLRVASAFASVALERLVNIAGFCVVLGVAALAIPLPPPIHRWLPRAAGAVAAVVLVALVVARRRSRFPRSSRRLRRRPGSVREVRVQVRRALRTVRRIGSPPRLAGAGGLTLVDWACQLASYHLVARAAHLQISLEGSVLALLAVNLGLIVRVTPGNVGIFELAYSAAAVTQGADPAAALGVGMLLHLVQDLPTIVLGLAAGHSLRRGAPGANDAPAMPAAIAPAERCTLGTRPSPGGSLS